MPKTPVPSESIDPALVRKRLEQLQPVLAKAVVGDFSQKLKVPEKEDAFTELFVGVRVMQEVISKQIQELQALNQALEEKAAENRGALEEAQALTHLGSWEWDMDSGHISWSDELYRIYGLKPQEREVGFEEFMGMIHPDDRQYVSQTIGVSSTSGAPFQFEHRIILADGSERTLSGIGKVIRDKSGKMIRMVGTSQDITVRKRSELDLQQSDERFRTVSKATHDLVYDWDIQRQQIWFNEILQNDYGYKHDGRELSVEWWRERIHPEDAERIKSQLNRLLKGGDQAWDAEYRFRKADDSYTTVRNRAFVLRTPQGEPRRVIGTCLDITEAKRLDRAKDEFISLVSHQLRTPLTVINLYANMLTDGIAGKLETQQQEYVTKISSASIRLIKLVGDILNISRLELNRIKIHPVLTDINQLIQGRIDELQPTATAKATSVTFKPHKDIYRVKVDPTIFSEVVHNLISNAIRYGPSQDGMVRVSFKPDKRGYLLSVTDNGIGIAASDQPHILERFYRAPNASNVDGEGTGLGLYLVKLFVDTAGGKIWFKSTEGKGTTFYVLFPAAGMTSNSS